MFAGEVIVAKRINAQHIIRDEVTNPHPQIRLVAVIRTMETSLGKHHPIPPIVKWNQQVKLRIFQRQFFVSLQLHAGGSEAVQELLHLTTGRGGCHAVAQGNGRIRIRVVSQKAPGAGRNSGNIFLAFIVN